MHDIGLVNLALILLGALVVILASGVWIAVALGLIGFVAMLLTTTVPIGAVLATTVWSASASWALAALPLFIWMGEILFHSRLSEDLFSGLTPWMTRLPGRLLHVNILGCGIFAAVSGSSAATAATIGKMSMPELLGRGYDRRMAIGTLAGSGTLGLLIPPSIILIVYGVATEDSIARLFIAGILPGIMLVLLFMGYVAVWAMLHPDRVPQEALHVDWGMRIAGLRRLAPVVLLIAGVIASIYAGIASPTDMPSGFRRSGAWRPARRSARPHQRRLSSSAASIRGNLDAAPRFRSRARRGSIRSPCCTRTKGRSSWARARWQPR